MNACISCSRHQTCPTANSSVTSCTKYHIQLRIHNLRSRVARDLELQYGIPFVEAYYFLTDIHALEDSSYYRENRPVDLFEFAYLYEEWRNEY